MSAAAGRRSRRSTDGTARSGFGRDVTPASCPTARDAAKRRSPCDRLPDLGRARGGGNPGRSVKLGRSRRLSRFGRRSSSEGAPMAKPGKHSPYVKLPAVNGTADQVNVVIETPRGCRNKYKFDDELGVFRLSSV